MSKSVYNRAFICDVMFAMLLFLNIITLATLILQAQIWSPSSLLVEGLCENSQKTSRTVILR